MQALRVHAVQDVQVRACGTGLAGPRDAQQAADLRREGVRGCDATVRAPGDRGQRTIRGLLREAREVLRGMLDDVQAQAIEPAEPDQ